MTEGPPEQAPPPGRELWGTSFGGGAAPAPGDVAPIGPPGASAEPDTPAGMSRRQVSGRFG